jgi:hypothetical protein
MQPAVDELPVLEPLPPDANGAGGDQNHLIPLKVELLHLKYFHIFYPSACVVKIIYRVPDTVLLLAQASLVNKLLKST